MSNWEAGDTGVLVVKQDGTGGRTLDIDLSGDTIYLGNTAYTASSAASATDVLGWYYDGTNFYVSIGYGDANTTGAKGAPGAQGATGATGTQGATGPQGTVAGPQGPDGGPGAQGADGGPGATGGQGAAGQKGADGSQGTTGPGGASIAYTTSTGTTSLSILPAAGSNINKNGGAILGGDDNEIGTGNARYNSIVNGGENLITGSINSSVIAGGDRNIISGSEGNYNAIIASYESTITSSEGGYRIIIGGTGNALTGSAVNNQGATIIGTGIEVAGARNTVYVNNQIVTGSLTVGGLDQLSTTKGRIDATNDVVAYSTSDINFKDNITPIIGSIDKVMKISGVEFDWKPLTEEQKVWLHGNDGHDVGVIAQEIEKVLPEVVTTRENGFKAVRYEKLIPLLIEAIKELKQEIDSLKNE